MKQRLDVLLRGWGAGSRRSVRQWTAEGRIALNGETVTDPALYCDENAVITLDGEALMPKKSITLMMNKPAGYVCVGGEAPYPGVFSLLDDALSDSALFAVGRLDANTQGLLLLTNDGPLCDKIIRPEAGIVKKYFVSFDRALVPDAAQKLAQGVRLPDGTSFLPAIFEPVSERSGFISVKEGKYHEVKRLVRACGAQVAELKRVSIGALELDNGLGAGQYRPLSDDEIKLIFE